MQGSWCTRVLSFETGSQASGMTMNLLHGKESFEFLSYTLPLPPRCWGSRNEPPRPSFALLEIKPRALCMLGEHCTH